MAQFQNGTFACCNDVGTCCLAYFCPCVVAGQNAEAMGESCLLFGLLSTLGCVGVFSDATIRRKVREKYGIQNGTFACFNDVGTCCMTYFCPCVVAGQNAEAMGESCLLYGFLSTCGCIGIFTDATIRQKIREKYGIQGDFVMDLVCHFFCPCCSLIQEAQEIKAHGGAPGGVAMART